MQPYEQLGLFYLGKRFDLATRTRLPEPVLYDSADMLTHAVCVGMTGSGKTGLGIAVIEEAALDGIPVLALDPKGDLPNLLLNFPGFTAAEFEPWANEGDAAAAGMNPRVYAAQQAERWRQGLVEWDQDSARMIRLRTTEVRVYTPGSRAATPLALLANVVPSASGDDEATSARVAATTQSILALAGAADVPAHSREHVLVATLLQHAARAGQSVDLPWLVQHVQKPPFERVGVLDLDTFYPGRDRQELALRLNAVLASPGFDVWLSGESVDMSRLLYTSDGRPRIAIVSIAHLDDAQRMLAVSLVLNEALAWTRRQSGTSSLRAMIYMDEVAGYLPPVANPPSKAPLLMLLKQARAFGVGVMLSTQNPVDLDYKGLSNAGTWFLGKLQTARDKSRVLDGLEGAAAGAYDRAELDKALSSLGKRVFLLHNVHEREPVVFETRWTMSYLRGPMTKEELRRVTAREAKSPLALPDVHTGPPVHARPAGTRPIVPVDIREFFMPTAAAVYEPRFYGSARVTYTDARRGVDVTRDVHVTAPFGHGAIAVNWNEATDSPVSPESLASTPVSPEAPYAPLPSAAADARSYPVFEREFERWLIESRPLKLFRAPTLKLSSAPDESEREFRIRVQQARHEARDAAVERLRAKYAPRLARLTELVSKAQDTALKERQQVDQQKVQTAVSIGATVIGALLGRKAISTSTLGRATTAARSVSRSAKEQEDVARAEGRVLERQDELATLESELQAEIDTLSADTALDEVEIAAVKSKRGGVTVRLVALVWIPTGAAEPGTPR